MLLELLRGFLAVLDPRTLALTLFGVTAGLLVGALPGLTATMAVALLVPITFGLRVQTALSMLLAIYVGAVSGGLVSAILINTPGTPASVATTFDGYPMARKGEAGRALGVALLASIFGSLIGIVSLILLAPLISSAALKFSAPEYAALALFGLTMAVGISGPDIVKGLSSAVLGLFVGMVGLDPMLGYPRFTFGTVNLMGGFPFVPVLIGLFAVSEALSRATDPAASAMEVTAVPKQVFPKLRTLSRNWLLILKSGVIGTFIGALPGAGADIASLVSYGEARRSSKHPERFGTGEVEGVIASETANNAVIGGAMIPLLTLGIPGDAVTAVLLGAMMMHGVRVGPLVFEKNRAEVFVMYAALFVSVLLLRLVAIVIIRPFAQIVRVRQSFIIPGILILCFIGSYATANSVFVISVAVGFGILGFLMTRYGFPVAPTVLAIILGPLLEDRFRQSLVISRGSWLIFITRPISAGILVLAVVFLIFSIRQQRRLRDIGPRSE